MLYSPSTLGICLIAPINGSKSGEVAALSENQQAKVRLKLKWTFPMDYVEIISGNGKTVKRQRLDLSNTSSFDEKSLSVDVDLAGQRWLRVEAWDVATNGAFTQPIWLQQARSR